MRLEEIRKRIESCHIMDEDGILSALVDIAEAAKEALGCQVYDWKEHKDYSPAIKKLQKLLQALENKNP